MTRAKLKHKFTAILSAELKGHNILMGKDEDGNLRTLNPYK